MRPSVLLQRLKTCQLPAEVQGIIRMQTWSPCPSKAIGIQMMIKHVISIKFIRVLLIASVVRMSLKPSVLVLVSWIQHTGPPDSWS